MAERLFDVYNRAAIAPVSGRGAWLLADDGTEYLDCVGGIAVNALGHCHPALVAALTEQAGRLWHVSNMFRVPGQETLAERLCATSFAERVFFCNTGAEAVECAIKTARRFHAARGAHERVDVIGFAGSFHGRTYAALNASGNPAYLDGCGPAMPGFVQVALEDHAAVAAAIAAPGTAAVIVEPVQGEGGARAVPVEVLEWLRAACDTHGVLLIHDEVQCGMGRTGRLWAHQWAHDAAPDLLAAAKALGGGFPVGACLASERAAAGMTPGAHGSTFGGNPLAMAVALAAFDLIADPAMLARVEAVSASFRDRLAGLQARYPGVVAEIRGKGLLVGLRLHPHNRDVIAAARAERLLIAGGGENCIRLLPPLTIGAAEIGEIVARLERTLARFAQIPLAA